MTGKTIEIMCPVCGGRQTVERWMWEFSIHTDERGNRDTHPLTCSGGGGPCPADTEMVPVEEGER